MELRDLQPLEENSAKYQARLLEKSLPGGLTITDYLRQLFDQEIIQSLVITNAKQRKSPLYYILRIEKEKFELAEKNATSVNNFVFDFKSGRILFNKRPMSPVYGESLRLRIRTILEDIKSGAAGVFEEKILPGSAKAPVAAKAGAYPHPSYPPVTISPASPVGPLKEKEFPADVEFSEDEKLPKNTSPRTRVFRRKNTPPA